MVFKFFESIIWLTKVIDKNGPIFVVAFLPPALKSVNQTLVGNDENKIRYYGNVIVIVVGTRLLRWRPISVYYYYLLICEYSDRFLNATALRPATSLQLVRRNTALRRGSVPKIPVCQDIAIDSSYAQNSVLVEDGFFNRIIFLTRT